MEAMLKELLEAAEAVIEDAELIDGYSYGQLVSPSKIDRLRAAIADLTKGELHA